MAPVTLVQTRTIVDPEYGAKLTGKVGRMSMVVVATNDQAPGKVDSPSDPAFGQSARVFLGRARYDLYSESHIGLLATNREFLDSHNRMGGIDGSFRIGSNHQAGIFAMGSLDRDLRGGPATRTPAAGERDQAGAEPELLHRSLGDESGLSERSGVHTSSR